MGVNLPKLRAIIKCEAPHIFDTIGNINLPEGVTALKSGNPYCFDCFWNLHLIECYASTKCMFSNRCHSFLYDHLVNLRLFVLPGTPFTGTSIVEIRHFPFTGYRNGLIVSADRPFNICAEDRILDVRKRSIQHRGNLQIASDIKYDRVLNGKLYHCVLNSLKLKPYLLDVIVIDIRYVRQSIDHLLCAIDRRDFPRIGPGGDRFIFHKRFRCDWSAFAVILTI